MLDMEAQQVRQMILDELPKLMQNDMAFRESVISIAQFRFADKAETDSRFEKMMTRFDRFMDEDRKKWDESQQKLDRFMDEERKKWNENQRQIAALNVDIKDLNRRLEQKIDQDRQKWIEYQQKLDRFMDEERDKWDENQKKWDENQRQIAALNADVKDLNRQLAQKIEEEHQARLEDQRKWEQQQQISERKWEENQRESKRKWEENQRELKDFNRKHDQLIGAVGSRWGLQSEASFRNALAGILKDFQGVSVMNVVEWDDTGAVFGHPDQIELDIIIKNGVLIVCEVKSSVSKSDMYIFERKVRFYEQKQTKPVTRMLVISPFVDKHAMPVAEKLGIEVYSYADDVNL